VTEKQVAIADFQRKPWFPGRGNRLVALAPRRTA